MKLQLIAAAASIVASFGAHALTPAQIGNAKVIYVAGASAQRITFGAYVQELCTLKADGTAGAHNDLDVYFNDAATPGNNSRGYACTLSQPIGNFAADTVVVIYKRDQSGSAAGVGPVNDQTANARLDITVAGCTRVVANPSPVTDIQKQSYNCTSIANQVPDVGLADVEPARFSDSVNLPTGGTAPNTSSLTVINLANGIFGVVVNTKLYRALQTAQGIPQVDVPADQSTWTAADIANIPSLPSTFVSSALLGRLAGGTSASLLKGWNIVMPNDVGAGNTINILRRVEGSGTQAASALFFGQNAKPYGCDNDLSVASGACSTAPISVNTEIQTAQEYASSGDLETGFATADSLGAYALGVIGRENNPLANGGTSPKAYRYVKLDGIAPITSLAAVGDYKFVYTSTVVYNKNLASTSDATRFAIALGSTAGMGKAATLARADVDSQQGALALPTFSGPYELLGAAVKKFSSAVSRSSGNSNTTLTRAK